MHTVEALKFPSFDESYDHPLCSGEHVSSSLRVEILNNRIKQFVLVFICDVICSHNISDQVMERCGKFSRKDFVSPGL